MLMQPPYPKNEDETRKKEQSSLVSSGVVTSAEKDEKESSMRDMREKVRASEEALKIQGQSASASPVSKETGKKAPEEAVPFFSGQEDASFFDLSDMPVYSAKEKGPFVPGDGQVPVTQAELIAALKEVNDPELMLNIYDLGLVYKADISDEGDVLIEMTLTSPLCPMADMMPQMVAQRVALLDGVREVSVFLVWEPVWTMDRMSEDYKLMLNLF